MVGGDGVLVRAGGEGSRAESVDRKREERQREAGGGDRSGQAGRWQYLSRLRFGGPSHGDASL